MIRLRSDGQCPADPCHLAVKAARIEALEWKFWRHDQCPLRTTAAFCWSRKTTCVGAQNTPAEPRIIRGGRKTVRLIRRDGRKTPDVKFRIKIFVQVRAMTRWTLRRIALAHVRIGRDGTHQQITMAPANWICMMMLTCRSGLRPAPTSSRTAGSADI